VTNISGNRVFKGVAGISPYKRRNIKNII
jgi:hypothetical protein